MTLGRDGVQPPRSDGDGEISVQRVDEMLVLRAVTRYSQQTMVLSGFNAWRIFGCMALMLGVKLSLAAQRKIKLGDGKAEAKPSAAMSPSISDVVGAAVVPRLAETLSGQLTDSLSPPSGDPPSPPRPEGGPEA